jgi:hypothetical protein
VGRETKVIVRRVGNIIAATGLYTFDEIPHPAGV